MRTLACRLVSVVAVVGWKKALLVALVVLIALLGVPMLMSGTGMATCHDCGAAILGPSCMLALLTAAVAIALSAWSRPAHVLREHLLLLLRAALLERPPQLA